MNVFLSRTTRNRSCRFSTLGASSPLTTSSILLSRTSRTRVTRM
nr:MAG TPA: hypothetical protein [Caudoviricetes sp.]